MMYNVARIQGGRFEFVWRNGESPGPSISNYLTWVVRPTVMVCMGLNI